MRAVEQAQQVARTGGGQEGLASTLGDAYCRRPRRVGCAVEGFSDPRGYFTWWDLTAGYEQNL